MAGFGGIGNYDDYQSRVKGSSTPRLQSLAG